MARTAVVAALCAALATACSDERTGPIPAQARGSSAEPAVVFSDRTAESGLDFVHHHGGSGRKFLPEIMGSGGAALDYDGDGWTDVYLMQAGPFPGAESPPGTPDGNRLFRNLGGGVFTDVSGPARAAGRGYGMGAVAGDVDGDGDTDLYLVNYGPDRLLLNAGDGTFRDTTEASGISNPLWGSSAALFDADLDGRLDLYVANYLEFSVETHVDCGHPARGLLTYCHPDVYPAASDRFFRNLGGGQFAEASREAGLIDASGKGLGVAAADFTGDGLPDLYVANDSTPNFLFENLGGGQFREEALLLGVAYNEDGQMEAGMGIAVGDVDRDGRLDIFVTNLSHETNALYLGGDAMFRYATRSWGLVQASYLPVGFGTDLADLDNDGGLDLLVLNGHVIDTVERTGDAQSFRQPGQVFWNGAARFQPVDDERIADLRVPRVGRGTITLDADHDGRLDVIGTFNHDRARLFRNELESAGGWIQLQVIERESGSAAIGARATVLSTGSPQIEELTAGSSYQTGSAPVLHFGLGEAGAAERVTVRWPRGAAARFHDLPAGRIYRIPSPSPGR